MVSATNPRGLSQPTRPPSLSHRGLGQSLALLKLFFLILCADRLSLPQMGAPSGEGVSALRLGLLEAGLCPPQIGAP